MLRNYIKVALRSMQRNKVYALINVLGLAIGIAASILILLFVIDEMSYDRYHEKHERIFRISREWVNPDGETNLHLGHVAPPFGPLLRNDFEGIIQEEIRFLQTNPLIGREDRKFVEDHFYFADPEVFEMFSWHMISGDPATALADPSGVVITESAAFRYFGTEDPMEKELMFTLDNSSFPLKVTGVIEDIPRNSHFDLDLMGSMKMVENFYGAENLMKNFGSNNYSTYILLPEGYRIEDLEAQIPDFIDRHLEAREDGTPAHVTNKLHFMPLADIHLYSHLDSEIGDNGDIAFVYLFSLISLFILIIACINFMNLSTAKSSTRSKEVGLRKVMGAFKSALVKQFIVESIIYTFISLCLAMVIVTLVLPWFNEFAHMEVSFNVVQNRTLFVVLIAVLLFVGFLAGSSPAFFIASFQPAEIIKKTFNGRKRKFNLRSVLVVTQFALSIGLIIGVAIVRDQIDFMLSKPLGYDKDNIMVFGVNNKMYTEYETLKERLESHPGIDRVTLGSRIPSNRLMDSMGMDAEVNGEMKQITFRVADVHVDHDFVKLFGLKILAGRDFDPLLASDSTESFIINKSAMAQIGWASPEEAVGKKVNYGPRKGEIIGVVDNFHFESLHQKVAPVILLITDGRYNSMAVKYDPEQKSEVESYLKDQWTQYQEGIPFDYYEIEENLRSQYESERLTASLGEYFSWLAIFIASLGLYGLASFIAEKRQKELGIRKVMGATLGNLIVLLTRNFTILILLAFAISSPIIYWFMTDWLDQFAYADSIKLTPFIYAGLLALFIAWITISYQIIRAALVNPANTLRDE